jgi:hypothetical protein
MYRRTCRTAAPRVHGKVVRDGEDRFHEEDLGPVTFVPLIGAAGWAEPAVDAAPAFERLWPRRPAVSARAPSATDLIREAAEPLPEPDDPAFGAMFDRFAKARVVLLGEATHGTSEFYRARAQITRRLIERHGFNIVAVEADWPDAACEISVSPYPHPRATTQSPAATLP